MAKYSPNEIRGFNDDWGNDDRVNLPYGGGAIQNFVKDNLRAAVEGLGGKIGAVDYVGGVMNFYDEDGGRVLASVSLSGTSYIVSVESSRPSSFYVLTNDEDAIIDIKPKTESVEIGQSQRDPFPEDYTFSLEVDGGNGYIDRTPTDNNIRQGETKYVDIKKYLTTGVNKIRIIVKGVASEQPRTMVYTATLTSLTLSCNHEWHKAWIEGEEYGIGQIVFGGNIQKVLHVMVDDTDYTQTFAASTNYINTPYTFDLKDRFPGSTGIHHVKVWIEGQDVSTTPIEFNIMCVKAAETATARLVCLNDVPKKVVNYNTQSLFRYATYNVTEVVLDVTGMIGDEEHPIVTDMVMATQTQVKNTYTTSLQLDTEVQTGLSVMVALAGGDEVQRVTIPLDNSNAFVATAGATFYMNTALRSNKTADRKEIHNTAAGAQKVTYRATWDGFTFADDAHSVDADGNKCLAVKAGSLLTIPDLKPLDKSATQSLTVEWMYRASNIADYDTPVMSMMTTSDYDKDATRGIVCMPTRIVVMSSNEKQETYQKIDLPEDRIIHVAVVIQRNFASSPYNICRVFVNGRENVAFQFSGISTFTENGTRYGYVRVGQASTDYYMYMMRCYDRALEGTEVFANYLNAMIDTAERSRLGERADNTITDGGAISYDMVKKAGFNTYVVETDEAIPSKKNPSTENLRVNLHLEYNDNPEWNVSIYNIPMDGQGTTSMLYAKWNLRDKIKSGDTRWVYPNYNGGTEETGKDGYIAGYGLHPKVSVITAKKNVASSPQGHKMGATAFYHELFVACEGTEMLPNANCRVAVYQHPFVGFQKFSDGHYEFIGLYTVGPDKKDKKTFGYNATSDYPSLMMLEGPNHAPYMTRFLVPWTDDVFYDYQNETLSTGDTNSKQEGWDADIAAGYGTDAAEDAAAVMALYRSEFKPAYDAIYYNSPYLASLAESGYTLEQINANITTFQSGRTRGLSNGILTFYTEDYELVYFRYKTGRYEVLPKTVHDMLYYLGFDDGARPTTEELLARRAENWKVEVFEVVSKQEALFHESFCELLGVTDNHAKNTYWRKFAALAAGGKWGFNQDDLDTLFETDNNGQDTKEYWIEPGDTNLDGGLTYQGSDSAFWYALRLHCKDELRDKMLLIVQKAMELAAKYNVSAPTTQQTLFNLIGYYFWNHSSKYFPALAYNEDALFAYINVWLEDPTILYNNVYPLTQVHGDHYETERAWVERRIAYIFSKYRIGGFNGSATDGYGALEFAPGNNFDMKVKPAIALYPRMSEGGSDSKASERTMAGDVCVLKLAPIEGGTTAYIKGMDWLEDLGDLSGMKVTARSGSDVIVLGVNGKRLRRLKVGDADAEKVLFNVNMLTVSGESIEEIDARNAATLRGVLNLSNTPRLKVGRFGGTSLGVIMPPVGGRVREWQLPESTNTLFLHSLNLLQQSGLTIPEGAWRNITDLYFNECSQINPLDFVHGILSQPDNVLQFVTLIWDGEREVTNNAALESIAALATKEGVGAIEYNGGELQHTGNTPDIQGKARVNFSCYQDTIDTIQRRLPNLKVLTDKPFHIRFKDAEVLRVLLENGVGDGTGITKVQLENLTSIGTWFNNTLVSDLSFLNNTNVKKFESNALNCRATRFVNSVVTSFGKNVIPYSNQYTKIICLYKATSVDITGDYGQNYLLFAGCPNVSGFNVRWRYALEIIDCGKNYKSMGSTDYNATNMTKNATKWIMRSESMVSPCTVNLVYISLNTYFVPESIIEHYKDDTYWSKAKNLYSIGSPEWQSAMRTLAEQYAAEYAGWSAEQMATADYSDPYIDYRIFGVEPPTE